MSDLVFDGTMMMKMIHEREGKFSGGRVSALEISIISVAIYGDNIELWQAMSGTLLSRG